MQDTSWYLVLTSQKANITTLNGIYIFLHLSHKKASSWQDINAVILLGEYRWKMAQTPNKTSPEVGKSDPSYSSVPKETRSPSPDIIDLVDEAESESETSGDTTNTTDSKTEEERGSVQPSRAGSVVRYPYLLTEDQKRILKRKGMEQSCLENVSFSSSSERYAWVGNQLRAPPSTPPKRIRLTAKQKDALINFGYPPSYLETVRFRSTKEGFDWVGMKIDSALENNILLKFFGPNLF